MLIDGEVLSEEYLYDSSTDGDIDAFIPDGFYFVMADNRSYGEEDSRSPDFGLIGKEQIYGKIIYRF